MAECVVARCVQERRFLKRELQKWGKNVLYLVGLERVAEELIGHDKWAKIRQPLFEIDSNEVVDWSPDAKCCFCNNHRQSLLDPAKALTSFDGATSESLTDQEQGVLSVSGSRATSPSSPDSDQPLDLSLGNKARSHSPNLFNGETGNSSALLKVPHIPDKSGKLKRRIETSTSCKRSYTEDELQAALRDIRSGKLGTRRAAVIYGIPRSTLRNKVYKLALDKSGQEAFKHACETPNKEGKKDAVEGLVCNGSESGVSASESLKRLLRNRMAGKLESKQTSLDSQSLQLFAGLESNPALAPFLSHVLANVHQLALASYSGSGKEFTNELKLSLLPDLIRKLSEERFEEECNRHRSATQNHESPDGSVILKIPSYKPVKTVQCEGSVSAGVSSQSGSTNTSNGAKGIGVTLREIIAKSITQKGISNKGSAPSTDSVQNAVSSSNGDTKKARTENLPAEVTVPLHMTTRPSTGKLAKKESKHDVLKSEKRMRPKRGRYRNYDRDNLVEAVRAVQRGEMSVHRAGSFFGVPHSTLEYKVKERHLLRPRKHRSSSAKAAKHASSSPSVTKGQSSSSNSSCSSSCNNSNGSVSSSTKGTSVTGSGENGNGTSSGVTSAASANSATSTNASNLWQNSPLFALDFSRLNSSDFFASQMMRKLQEDALMQGQGTTDSLSSRDALLVGVLIRNGLQAADTSSSNSTTK